MRVAIAGAGAIGLASAAWLVHAGHAVTVWSPRADAAQPLRLDPLRATGLLQTDQRIAVADSPAQLLQSVDAVLLAAPGHAHRTVIDALLPHLRSGQSVVISAMGSLSALYLHERARAAGRDVTVVSWGTTALTARRTGPTAVHVMTQRAQLGISALPRTREADALALCKQLFGDHFAVHGNALATTLNNTNPIAHVPLLLANWTRMERAEAWPQYHYMTPRVSAVIEQLDAERLAVAQGFGLQVRSIAQHFAQSFGTTSATLADIAAELHALRGGPPGPTTSSTRYLWEDVPFGLVFQAALGRVADVPTPATNTLVEMASLLAGQDFAGRNDLIGSLGLAHATRGTLLARVDG